MSNSNVVVTVSADYKKAVFTWSEDCSECEYTAVGFDDSEIDLIMESKAHMGSDVEGYTVEIN